MLSIKTIKKFVRKYHDVCHRLFGHTIMYEFDKKEFKDGWRGDKWCACCSYGIFSREAKRMEHFGLQGFPDYNVESIEDKGNVKLAMYRVSNLLYAKSKC